MLLAIFGVERAGGLLFSVEGDFRALIGIVRKLSQMATAVSLIVISGCIVGDRPMDLSVMNVSDDEFYVDNVDAPEFAYRPPVGVMIRNGRKSSGRAVKSAPTQVLIEVRGKPPETVSVPPLPADLEGDIELFVVYTRSRRWVARWEVTPDRDVKDFWRKARLIPDDDDPRFRLHKALLDAAEAGDVRAVDDLLQKGAPLRWDTTEGNPLATAARWNKNDVIDRLLKLGDSAFTPADIDDAVWAAADGDSQDDSTLRLLISRFGSALGLDARARALTHAAESHRSDDQGRRLPAGPAIRFLIDEAKFDVNTPLTDSGHTVLDVASAGSEWQHDRALIEFLKARGARSGLGKK
jgi:hypothetical protein